MATKSKNSGGFTKVSSLELKDARSAGFKRLKPKKPKGKFSMIKFDNYKQKFNAWAKDVKSHAKDGKKIRADKDKLSKARATLSGI